jgi:hypothetical protein
MYGMTMRRKILSVTRYEVAAARKPFIRGERTCCDMRSGDHRPKCSTVSVTNTGMLHSQAAKPIADTTNGALTARRRTTSGGPSGRPRLNHATIGQRYPTMSGVHTP